MSPRRSSPASVTPQLVRLCISHDHVRRGVFPSVLGLWLLCSGWRHLGRFSRHRSGLCDSVTLIMSFRTHQRSTLSRGGSSSLNVHLFFDQHELFFLALVHNEEERSDDDQSTKPVNYRRPLIQNDDLAGD